MRSKVVFPQPDGPNTVRSLPFFSVKLMSLSACILSPLGDLKISDEIKVEMKLKVKNPNIEHLISEKIVIE